MLDQPARFLLKGLLPCLLLSNALSSSLSASPGGTQDSTIVPIARHQIAITASVRPTLAVRQQIRASDGNHAICIKSNIPMMNYDVKVEGSRGTAISLSHSLKKQVTFECSIHNESASLLKKIEIADTNFQKPGAVTLIIAPH